MPDVEVELQDLGVDRVEIGGYSRNYGKNVPPQPLNPVIKILIWEAGTASSSYFDLLIEP